MISTIREVVGRVLHDGDGGLVTTRFGQLYVDGRRVATVNTLLGRRPAITYTERLFRNEIRHVAAVDEGYVVFASGMIAAFDRQWRQRGEPTSVVGRRPLGVATLRNGVWYGEYRANRERTAVAVMHSDDGGVTWRRWAEYDDVRHVHHVAVSERLGGLLVTTGDDDDESRIELVSFGDASDRRVLLAQGQASRAVQVIETRTGLYFGTDDPDAANRIRRLDLSTGQVDDLGYVDGPVFFGARLGGQPVFSTVAEPSRHQPPRTEASLFVVTDDGLTSVFNRRWDRLHRKYFQYPQLRLVEAPSGRAWIVPFACRGRDRSQLLEVTA